MLYDKRWEKPLTALNVIRAAADLLERDGWCQFGLRREGKRCIMGALLDCSPHAETYYHTCQVVMRGLGTEFISKWNDTAGRTQEEVVAALRSID